MTSSTIPISDRTTAGETPSEKLGAFSPPLLRDRDACDRRAVVEREAVVRRRVATR